MRLLKSSSIFLATGLILGVFLESERIRALGNNVVDFSSSALQVCQDDFGNFRNGDLDVLILLDNSKSLWESDKRGVRFDAIESFVENFQKIGNRGKSFGLVKFGGSAEVVIPFGAISSQADVQRIKQNLRSNVPNSYESQESFTNYVSALEVAREEFLRNDSDNRNCRVLIWFTDGVFDTNDSDQDVDIQRDVKRLEVEVCSSDGFGVSFAEADINTFVVYLNPSNPNRDRSQISQDAMQVITGDREPSFGSQDSSPRTPSSDCVVGPRHLGEVLSVEDSNSLLGFLTDLVPTADGATPVFPEECPIQTSELTSNSLIDGHLVEWISVTSWQDNIDLSVLTVEINNDEVQPLTNMFESEKKDDRLYYLRPSRETRELLNAGWKLSLSGAGDICVRLKPIGLKFKITRDNEVKSLNELPDELFRDRLIFYAAKIRTTLLEAVRNPGEITGQLEIDFGEFLATPNLLPAEILVDGAFQISPPNCNLRIEIEGDVPSEPIKSTTCLVTPARTDDTFFDASRLISKLDGCGLGPWQLLVYGKVSQLTGALEANGLPAEFSVETVGTPANIETRCNQSVESAIAISTSQTSSDLRSEVRIRLVKRGDIAIAILFALVMTMLVSLVSLLLLRVLNILMAKTVDGNSFFAYEADAEIESDRSGVSSLQWSDLSVTTKNYVANPDRLEPVRTNRSRTELKAGDLTFERQLPSIFRPFAEPRLKLISAKPAIFWQSNSQRDGLPLTFAKAIVITRVGTNDVVLRSSSKVRFTVIVPRRGIGSGFSGAEELVRDKAEKLAGDLGIELANQVDKAAGKNQADLSENASARETKTGDMAKVPSAKLPPTNAPMPPSPHPIRSFSSEPPMPPS